jgi:hypothetical protein
MITKEQLAEWRELCEKATEGPWAWEAIGEMVNGYVLGLACDENGELVEGYIEDDPDAITDPIIRRSMIGEHEAATCNYGDPEFIAAARTALPALLDEVERLRSLLAAIVPSPRLVTQSPRGRDSTVRIVCDEPNGWGKTIEAGLLYDANEAIGRKLGQ